MNYRYIVVFFIILLEKYVFVVMCDLRVLFDENVICVFLFAVALFEKKL